MTKAIFFNIPASGHINPSLALTAELVRRGEQISYYNTESFRRVIESTGATFRPYPTHITDSYFDERGLDGSNPPRSSAIMIATCREMLPQLIETLRAEQPAYVLYDSMCPWGALVARILDIPSITSLAVWAFTAGMMIRSMGLRTVLTSTISGLPHIMRFRQISGQIGAQYGIKPLGYIEFFNAPADLTISYTSAEFQPEAEKLDKRIRYVGPSVAPRNDAPDFPLDQLDGKPVIYISLGTLINTNIQFFKDCITAFADSRYTVVMAIGSRLKVDALGAVPANILVRNYVPQTEIVRRSVLFISHGGMNSVHDALYFGVPLLLVPQQAEQTFTAQRVEQCGAGLRLQNPTPATIRQSAESVLNDSTYRQRADAVGETLRDAGGAARAADFVLELVGKSGQ